uniref:hypothetical protein n=1 Tax=Roseovarius indicus TaxID=540747 RepID=UPI003B51914E
MNENEKALFNLFWQKLQEMSLMDKSKFIESEHFDELEVYIDAKPTLFPKRAVTLLKNPGTTSAARHQVIHRVLTILEALKKVPENIQEDALATSDALIPSFSLPEKDKDRIAELCEKMRRIIFSTTDFDEPHRLRLLNRIAAIEAEIHKPKGMFDVVRGGIDDLGETLGKFGKDIKPLTDRMQEVVSIARKNTKEYDQLPEPEEIKRLPSPESGGNEE